MKTGLRSTYKQFEELEDALMGEDVQGVARFWVNNWQPVNLVSN